MNEKFQRNGSLSLDPPVIIQDIIVLGKDNKKEPPCGEFGSKKGKYLNENNIKLIERVYDCIASLIAIAVQQHSVHNCEKDYPLIIKEDKKY